MARNLEVSIRIEMNETDAPLSADSEKAEAISSGHFRLVLDGDKSIEDETRRTFAEHPFTNQGQHIVPIEPPSPDPPSPDSPCSDSPSRNLPTFKAVKVEQAWQETSREMNHRGFTQEQIAKAKVQANELKRVHTTVARIEHQGKGFTLVGANLLTIFRFLLAFLLRNGLSQRRLRFYVNGQYGDERKGVPKRASQSSTSVAVVRIG